LFLCLVSGINSKLFLLFFWWVLKLKVCVFFLCFFCLFVCGFVDMMVWFVIHVFLLLGLRSYCFLVFFFMLFCLWFCGYECLIGNSCFSVSWFKMFLLCIVLMKIDEEFIIKINKFVFGLSTNTYTNTKNWTRHWQTPVIIW